MSLITIPYTFSAGATIIASEHNSNFSTISSDYNGNIDNNNISASAGIVYSKLSLTNGIVNADINSSAAIVASKLDLTSPGAIGSTAPSTGAFTTLKVGTTNQGDILYDNGTTFTRLTPGTSGQYLKTQGAAANPVWADVTTPTYLGSWASATNNSSTQATTGGFLVVYCAANASGTVTIKTDSSNPPTTLRVSTLTSATLAASVVCPVKKNDYYLIEKTGSYDINFATSYFISIGT